MPELDSNAQHKAGRPLRVAFLTNMIPPYQKPLLRLLSERYAALRVLVSTPMEANRSWAVDWEGLDVVLQKTLSRPGVWRHPRGFSEPLAVHIPLDTLSQLRRFSPDVIISAEMGARTLLALVFRAFDRRSRLIVWVEAAEANERGRGWMRHAVRRIFVRGADAFLAVGAGTVQYLERLGARRERIFKIAYPTDCARFAALPLARGPEQSRRLLYCGQLIERKGLVPFLSALSRWASDHPERQVEMVLAGDGPLRETLSRLTPPANVKLKFLGVIPYNDLPKIYASAGVFVLPTLADTWAVVVNEALAAGLPVLGSVYAQAVEELIQDGENGWTFRPDRAEDTYRAIDRMMNIGDAGLDGMRARARAAAAQLTPELLADWIGAAVGAAAGA